MLPVVKKQHSRLHRTPERIKQHLCLFKHIRKIHPKKEFSQTIPLILDTQRIPGLLSQLVVMFLRDLFSGKPECFKTVHELKPMWV